MAVVGYTILVVGCLFCLYWQLRFLSIAFDRSTWWLLGCLFVPFVDWVFFFLNFKATRKPFGLSLLGLAAAVLGGWLASVAWPE